MLENINAAQCSIYIQTPNLTCKPLIAAILDALMTRGIDVSIITSRKLMWLEQLITAGTVTEFEIWKLKRRYRYCLKHYETSVSKDPEAAGVSKPGKLDIVYYRPRDGKGHPPGEPVKSHLKLTIFDDKIAVLGSGNQDRASWYTSQELGIAFSSETMAADIRRCVLDALEDRLEQIL
jgi:phosphatidylserine/phosphatidylglycerophosphate/cardiolipin synthase-like enzyme